MVHADEHPVAAAAPACAARTAMAPVMLSARSVALPAARASAKARRVPRGTQRLKALWVEKARALARRRSAGLASARATRHSAAVAACARRRTPLIQAGPPIPPLSCFFRHRQRRRRSLASAPRLRLRTARRRVHNVLATEQPPPRGRWSGPRRAWLRCHARLSFQGSPTLIRAPLLLFCRRCALRSPPARWAAAGW
jgi:hypothetical protein